MPQEPLCDVGTMVSVQDSQSYNTIKIQDTETAVCSLYRLPLRLLLRKHELKIRAARDDQRKADKFDSLLDFVVQDVVRRQDT